MSAELSHQTPSLWGSGLVWSFVVGVPLSVLVGASLHGKPVPPPPAGDLHPPSAWGGGDSRLL